MNKTTKIILGVIVVVMVIVLVAIFYKPAPKETIKIGAVIPLTGDTSSYGEHMKEGIELAKDEINLNGGIKRRKLEIVYDDSQGNAQQGLTAYRELVDIKGIKIILSGISGVVLGIAPSAEKDQTLIFSIGAAAAKISEAGDFIFRHNVLPQAEAVVQADLVYNRMGYKEVAGIFVNAESGVSYRDEFKKQYEKLGGTMKTIEMYEKGTADFRAQLTKIKASGVKAVFAGSYIKELGYILKQSKELGLNIQWFSGYIAEGPEVIDIAGDAAEGLIYTHFFDPQSLSVEDYQNKFKRAYGKISEFYAALAYDNVKILAKVMETCSNAEDPICVKNGLYKIKNFSGVTGKITFDQNGDTQKTIILKTIKNGQFVPYL